jgi:hypothetical protein
VVGVFQSGDGQCVNRVGRVIVVAIYGLPAYELDVPWIGPSWAARDPTNRIEARTLAVRGEMVRDMRAQDPKEEDERS